MLPSKSCLIVAGEKSGEDHAMTFFSQLKKLTPQCQYYGVGGDRLKEQGVELKYHLKDFSGIGISEVLGKIPFYFKALDQLVGEVKARNTRTAILIDFQGFNLKLAKKLKNLGVNVLYYVAPQAWVWKAYRSKVLKKNVHTLFTILPFEKKWFKDRGVSQVRGVIHPLMIEYKEDLLKIRQRSSKDFSGKAVKLLLLPGSRNAEVCVLLPIFERGIDLIREDISVEVGIVKTESVRAENYGDLKGYSKVWEAKELPDALNWADLSIAASGTVTLATGLFELPTVVCYKVSLFTEFVLNMLITYKGPVSLTNIIHNKLIFPELIQYRADRYNIAKHVKEWVYNGEKYDQSVEVLKDTKTKLTGETFSVADFIAEIIKR